MSEVVSGVLSWGIVLSVTGLFLLIPTPKTGNSDSTKSKTENHGDPTE